MECPECNRLTEYQRLQQEYASAVNLFKASMAASEVRDHMELRAAADEARIDAEIARLELEKHKGVHRKTQFPADAERDAAVDRRHKQFGNRSNSGQPFRSFPAQLN